MDPQPRFPHAKVGRLHQRKGARTYCVITSCNSPTANHTPHQRQLFGFSASPSPGGCTHDLRILLDTFELLFEAATSLAQASVLLDIAPLTKLDGGSPSDRNRMFLEAVGGPNFGKAICIRDSSNTGVGTKKNATGQKKNGNGTKKTAFKTKQKVTHGTKKTTLGQDEK